MHVAIQRKLSTNTRSTVNNANNINVKAIDIKLNLVTLLSIMPYDEVVKNLKGSELEYVQSLNGKNLEEIRNKLFNERQTSA